MSAHNEQNGRRKRQSIAFFAPLVALSGSLTVTVLYCITFFTTMRWDAEWSWAPYLGWTFWGVIAMCGVATLTATILTTLISSHISRIMVNLAGQADQMSPRAQSQFGDSTAYTEIGRLILSLRRAARRFYAELARLELEARVDPATGLPNRSALLRILTTQLRGAAYETPVGFIRLVLDGYMSAAETLGDESAEALRKAAAERIQHQLAEEAAQAGRDIDQYTLAVLDEDCFAIVLPSGADREEASAIARRLGFAFGQPFELAQRVIKLDLSGGIVQAPEDGATAPSLVRRADLARRQGSDGGSNDFHFYTPRLDRITQSRFRLESDLRDAVREGAFCPVFQPKVRFETGEIIGAEALARWDRPQGRAVSPASFIPLAEETGLIEDIGRMILEKACAEAARWMEAGYPMTVAVNVSPRQFERPNFIDHVLDALRFVGLPPRLLELEITESLAVSSTARVLQVMRPLRAMGVKLAIDDFGTGHANLSILTQLPFDTFKIDRQFVSALDSGVQGPAIIEMILAMAETLGLQTVAEGVETESQADFLSRRGCEVAQGFLYSKGVPSDDFLDLVRTWRAMPVKMPKRAAG